MASRAIITKLFHKRYPNLDFRIFKDIPGIPEHIFLCELTNKVTEKGVRVSIDKNNYVYSLNEALKMIDTFYQKGTK